MARLRPLLMHRARGLCGPFFHKAANLSHSLVHGTGNFIAAGGGNIFGLYSFIAGYPAVSDVQNVAEVGDVMNLMPKGDITATSTHSTEVMALDYEGVYRSYDIDDPVWKGGRQVKNILLWSEDALNSVWNAGGGLIKNSSTDVTYIGTNSYIDQLLNGSIPQGTKLLHSVTLSGIEGQTVTLIMFRVGGTYESQSINIALTQTPTRHVVSHTIINADIVGFRFRLTREGVDDVTDLTIHDQQLEINQILPGEYIPTEATAVTKTFNTTNGNSVLNNIVTEAPGINIVPMPYAQANKAATNLLFPSEPPVTTSYTIPATEHILWIEGTGSITSSYGTATESAPLVFTGTAAGVLFTIVGSVDIAQIESGNIKQVYIPTTTAAASIPALDYTFPSTNIDPSNADISLTIEYSGGDTDVIGIAGAKLLTIGDVGDGIEKIINGEFTTDINNWASGTAPSAAIEWLPAGQAKATSLAAEYLGLFGEANFIAGETYVVSFDLISSNLVSQVRVGSSGSVHSSSSFNIFPSGSVSIGHNSTVYEAGSSLNFIYLGGRDDVNEIVVDNVSVQKVTKGVILADRSNNVLTLPITEGEHSVGVKLIATTMELDVDGTIQSGPYTLIPAGLITVSENFNELTVK